LSLLHEPLKPEAMTASGLPVKSGLHRTNGVASKSPRSGSNVTTNSGCMMRPEAFPQCAFASSCSLWRLQIETVN